MKLLGEGNKPSIQMDDKTLQKQIKVGQTISKINTCVDILEALHSQEYDGVQKLNIIIQIENKLIDLIDEL